MSLTISARDWANYIGKLSALNEEAAEKMKAFIRSYGFSDMTAVTDYAYGLATKYGEGSAALSAAMYDAVAEMSGKLFDPALPAETASYEEVARTVQGVARTSRNESSMGAAVGRLVKQAGADTTLKNALRDGAEFAWVPSGDTCAFCITLASRGWQRASKEAVKGGHADHIHNNCDCSYAIRFDGKGGVAGYEPEKYRAMYEGAEGETSQEKINSLRRADYAERREEINAQKRAAYAARREREKGLTSSGGKDILQPSKEDRTLELEDIAIGRSLGAARKSYDIEDLASGEHFDLVDGSHLEKVRVFAGKGVETPYRQAWKYVRKHPETREEDWQHVKAFGTINYYGEPRRAEIHWSQCEAVGMDDLFIKEWLD